MERALRPSTLLALVALLGVSASCNRPPLFEAVVRGDAAEIARLLDANADPNVVVSVTQPGHSGATFRLTPLAVAGQNGDVPAIELLVAAGADPHWDDGQFTAFEWAIRFEHPAAARRLWELSDGSRYASRGAVHIPLALRMDDAETLDFILDALGPASCETAAALTPLARSGSQRTEGEIVHVRALLDRGARPTPEALQWAASQARPGMTRLLLDRAERDGWLVGCVGDTGEGFDPLAGALRASLLGLEIDMVALLLERGADPNVRGPSGTTPAMMLARHVYLQEIYARPPYSDPAQPSPSAYYQLWFAPLLDLLVAHGADLSLRDAEGRSAADHVPDDDHDRDLKVARLRRLAAEATARAR